MGDNSPDSKDGDQTQVKADSIQDREALGDRTQGNKVLVVSIQDREALGDSIQDREALEDSIQGKVNKASEANSPDSKDGDNSQVVNMARDSKDLEVNREDKADGDRGDSMDRVNKDLEVSLDSKDLEVSSPVSKDGEVNSQEIRGEDSAAKVSKVDGGRANKEDRDSKASEAIKEDKVALEGKARVVLEVSMDRVALEGKEASMDRAVRADGATRSRITITTSQ